MEDVDFSEWDKEHPRYVLVSESVYTTCTDPVKKSQMYPVDIYKEDTIKLFLSVEGDKERDERIINLIKYFVKKKDEFAIDRLEAILTKGFCKRKIFTSIKDKFKKQIREEENKLAYNLENPMSMIKITNYVDNVEMFYKRNPFFYDRAGLWWFWNVESSCYEMVDEVDLMNQIDMQLGFCGETVTAGIRGSYIEAFKRVGRNHHPKEAPIKWIQFKDKAYSIHSGKIYVVEPNYFFTNPIPWEMGESDETPIFDKLFEEWVGKENVNQLYELIAYCCYRSYPIQTLFCLIGTGRNGKSTFLRILEKFTGNKNICSTDLDLIAGRNKSRFETAKLYKRLVCIMGETDFGVLQTSSIIKKLTGGDLIGFEIKGKGGFDDYNYAKLIIASNNLPTSEDNSEGFYRRWNIINFDNQFPEGKDITLDIPDSEYMNLAKKCCKVIKRVIEKGKFTNHQTIEERKKSYIMASNPFPRFVEEVCYTDENAYVRFSELFKVYTHYLKLHKKRNVSKKEMAKFVDLEGFESRRTSKDGEVSYYVEGLALKHNFRDIFNTLLPDLPDSRKMQLDNTYRESMCNFVESGQLVQKTDKSIYFLEKYIFLNPKDNLESCILIFGKCQIEKWLSEGEVYEGPKGTLSILK